MLVFTLHLSRKQLRSGCDSREATDFGIHNSFQYSAKPSG